MTKLPDKKLLDGSKMPKTTTREMKQALGELRDFLDELLGNDGHDREAARKALGIDLAKLNGEIQTLRDAVARRGTPVGSVGYFAMATPPEGYLEADGSAVGREAYPELFAAIGTLYGAGDGEAMFNLPDLIGRFPEGGKIPGGTKAAGLPNIAGAFGVTIPFNHRKTASGSFEGISVTAPSDVIYQEGSSNPATPIYGYAFNASFSNAVYGASETVQPASLILLPCIRATN